MAPNLPRTFSICEKLHYNESVFCLGHSVVSNLLDAIFENRILYASNTVLIMMMILILVCDVYKAILENVHNT